MIGSPLLDAARRRFCDLTLLALAGLLVLVFTSLGLTDRIPTGSHPAISIRADELRTLHAYLSCSFAWLALLGAAVILGIAELGRRDRAWLAAGCAALVQTIVLLPLFMGDNEVLAEWRWIIVVGCASLSFALFAALLGPVRRRIAALRDRHPFGAPLVFTAALGCSGAAAVALFHLLMRAAYIDLYPGVVLCALLWVQLVLFALARSVLALCAGTARRIAGVAVAIVGVPLVLAALAAGIGIVDGPRTARVRGILRWHCPQLAMLGDLDRSARREWTKVRRHLSSGRQATGFADPGALPASMAPVKRHHVIWFVADAMRRDSAGYTGAAGAATPNIDELARCSTVYANAFSPAPGTGDSMPSILTGLLPNTLAHAAKVPVFLPQLLQRHGYRGATNMRAKNAQFFSYAALEGVSMRALGMREDWKKIRPYAKADARSVNRLIDRMRAAKGPVFEYLHLLATHGPFSGRNGVTRRAAAIRSVDSQLGRLIAFLKDEGLWEDTVLFFFADHGEALGEHGMWAHAQALYAEQIAVPLIARVPGRGQRTVANPVTINVLPSLTMQALGARAVFRESEHDEAVPGLNVAWAVQERQIDGDITWRSIQYPPYVYHDKIADGSQELYRIDADPGEIVDLAGLLPDKLEEFRALERRIVEWELALAKSLE